MSAGTSSGVDAGTSLHVSEIDSLNLSMSAGANVCFCLLLNPAVSVCLSCF